MTIGMDFVSKTVDVSDDTSISKILYILLMFRLINLRYCGIG